MPTNIPKSIVTIHTDMKSQTFDFILQDNGFYILQDNGGKLILSQSVLHPVLLKPNVAKSSTTIHKVTKS